MNDWLNGELKYAFVKSIPVMCGYVFLGIAFGISLQEAGYGWIWALAMSFFIFAGNDLIFGGRIFSSYIAYMKKV